MAVNRHNPPGVYLLRLFIVIVLLSLSYLPDLFLMDDHPWVDLVWIVPIGVAAVLLGPLETLGVSLLALILSLTATPDTNSTTNLWTSAGIGMFGVITAIASRQIRQAYDQANIVREALDDSPLAFAELRFPGYTVINRNSSLESLAATSLAGDIPFTEALPGGAGKRLSELLDRAVASRSPVHVPEFRIPSGEGRESYWNISLIPMKPGAGRTPRAVAFFGSDVTEAVQRAGNREAALRISNSVMSNLDLRETMKVALESLTLIAGTDAGGLFLLEDDQWMGMAGAGTYDDGLIRSMRIPYEDLPTGVEAVERKRTVIVSDAANDERIASENLERFGMKSALVVPLIAGSRAVGAVWCVRTDEPHGFNEEQVEFATMMGAQAALAIENASIYDNEHMMRKSLEANESISEAGLVSLDIEEVLIELVTRTQDVMSMDAAVILLADEEKEVLEVRTVAGAVANPVAGGHIGIGQGLAGRAFTGDAPMKIDRVSGQEQEICPFAPDSGINSVLAVPLRMGGRTAGILQVGSLNEHAFSAREWGLIQVLADRASLAVQNSMLHEATRQELARVALLRDVAAACAVTQDIEEIARRSLEAIYEQLGCEIASIYYMDAREAALKNLAFMGHTPEIAEMFSTIPMSRETFLVKAVREQKVITHDTHPTSEASENELAILRSLGAVENRRAALPMVYRSGVVGGMALTMPGNRPFSQMELDTLKGITDQLAVAIHSSLPDYSGGEHPLFEA